MLREEEEKREGRRWGVEEEDGSWAGLGLLAGWRGGEREGEGQKRRDGRRGVFFLVALGTLRF